MLAKECMTEHVELGDPNMSVKEAATRMKKGDFGCLPIRDGDRLVGMITDRDIAIRLAAEGRDPNSTRVREVMTPQVLYCYEDQSLDEIARNMGDNQLRRLPVLNRQKRLVGILSIGDIAEPRDENDVVGEALGQISESPRMSIPASPAP